MPFIITGNPKIGKWPSSNITRDTYAEKSDESYKCDPPLVRFLCELSSQRKTATLTKHLPYLHITVGYSVKYFNNNLRLYSFTVRFRWYIQFPKLQPIDLNICVKFRGFD